VRGSGRLQSLLSVDLFLLVAYCDRDNAQRAKVLQRVINTVAPFITVTCSPCWRVTIDACQFTCCNVTQTTSLSTAWLIHSGGNSEYNRSAAAAPARDRRCQNESPTADALHRKRAWKKERDTTKSEIQQENVLVEKNNEMRIWLRTHCIENGPGRKSERQQRVRYNKKTCSMLRRTEWDSHYGRIASRTGLEERGKDNKEWEQQGNGFNDEKNNMRFPLRTHCIENGPGKKEGDTRRKQPGKKERDTRRKRVSWERRRNEMRFPLRASNTNQAKYGDERK
jgi:hypothetical protein